MTRVLRPLGDRIVIKPIAVKDKTAGGVHLPDTAKQKPEEGTIVAIGPGRVLDNGTRLELAVKVGDQVLYSKYAGADIKGDNDEAKFIIISEKDILCGIDEIDGPAETGVEV